jgi:hypothetical protein
MKCWGGSRSVGECECVYGDGCIMMHFLFYSLPTYFENRGG